MNERCGRAYCCSSQHSILIAWPLNLSDRLSDTFLIDAQKGEVVANNTFTELL